MTVVESIQKDKEEMIFTDDVKVEINEGVKTVVDYLHSTLLEIA